MQLKQQNKTQRRKQRETDKARQPILKLLQQSKACGRISQSVLKTVSQTTSKTNLHRHFLMMSRRTTKEAKRKQKFQKMVHRLFFRKLPHRFFRKFPRRFKGVRVFMHITRLFVREGDSRTRRGERMWNSLSRLSSLSSTLTAGLSQYKAKPGSSEHPAENPGRYFKFQEVT